MVPVFSTAIPLRGLSGAVRRLGYRFAEHRPVHWLLLLAGDRVEVWGHRLPRYLKMSVPIGLALGAVGIGGLSWAASRRRGISGALVRARCALAR